MRAITRITGVSLNTVTKLLIDAGKACWVYHDEHVRNVAGPFAPEGWIRPDESVRCLENVGYLRRMRRAC